MFDLSRLRALVIKEFIQVWRDKITLSIMIFLPIAQLLIFGFAVNLDVKHVAATIFDQSRTQESRELVAAFEQRFRRRVHDFLSLARLQPRQQLAVARQNAEFT